jgi:Putative auto-transporter adhesin, head GIN domain
MTALHERRHSDPARSPHRDMARWLLVVCVVVVVGVLSVTVVLLRGHQGNVPTGSSAVRGSGMAVSETRSLPPFTAVELAGSSNVTVQVGAPQSVVVHADDNLIGHVRTTVRSGALVVETTGSFSTRAPMRVSVVVPKVQSVRLSGSGNMIVDGVVSSAVTASLPGSGTMLVAGRTEHLEASLQGSGQMNLHGLIAREVDVQLPGSGEIQVYATDSLHVDVSGSGSVMYAGNPPHVTHSVSGSGAVEPE